MPKSEALAVSDVLDLDGVVIDELLAHHRNVELRMRLIVYGHNHADTEFVVMVESPDGTKETTFLEWDQVCEAYMKELGL
jgi:hypothetical protein